MLGGFGLLNTEVIACCAALPQLLRGGLFELRQRGVDGERVGHDGLTVPMQRGGELMMNDRLRVEEADTCQFELLELQFVTREVVAEHDTYRFAGTHLVEHFVGELDMAVDDLNLVL